MSGIIQSKGTRFLKLMYSKAWKISRRFVFCSVSQIRYGD